MVLQHFLDVSGQHRELETGVGNRVYGQVQHRHMKARQGEPPVGWPSVARAAVICHVYDRPASCRSRRGRAGSAVDDAQPT